MHIVLEHGKPRQALDARVLANSMLCLRQPRLQFSYSCIIKFIIKFQRSTVCPRMEIARRAVLVEYDSTRSSNDQW